MFTNSMNTNTLKQIICAAALSTLLLTLRATPVAASPAENAVSSLVTTHFSMDGGGHMVSGNGRFTLSSTFGQADATTAAGQGRYSLVGGFWGMSEGDSGGIEEIFLPLVRKD